MYGRSSFVQPSLQFMHFFIQARFQDQEYVVTQPTDDHLLDSEVRAILKAEYELLGQCDGFKDRFDSHAEMCEVRTIPRS